MSFWLLTSDEMFFYEIPFNNTWAFSSSLYKYPPGFSQGLPVLALSLLQEAEKSLLKKYSQLEKMYYSSSTFLPSLAESAIQGRANTSARSKT